MTALLMFYVAQFRLAISSFDSFLPYFSLIAGALGAMASVFGKLGLDPEAMKHLLHKTRIEPVLLSPPMLLLTRSACVGMMLLCNIAMTSFFVRSLHQSGSLLATVINTSINFVATGLAGHIFFKEALSLLWWSGAVVTLAGVVLLGSCSPTEATRKKGVEKMEESHVQEMKPRYQLRRRTR